LNATIFLLVAEISSSLGVLILVLRQMEAGADFSFDVAGSAAGLGMSLRCPELQGVPYT
jgi:preprotein translocase subunit SecG